MVNSSEILKKALEGKYCIAQFNINNLEWTKYILETCNEEKKDVILGVSEGAIKYMGGYNVVYNIVKALIKDLDIKINVVLHLDHGTTYESCEKAINAGFTSVMIDASKHSLKENIEITKKVVSYAKKHNVTVEAEVGAIGGSEDGIASEIKFATLEDSIIFVNETKIDTLAPALGSVHGIYKGEPNLNFKRMKEISEALKIPLVLHGGTGIPDDKIKKAIQCGTAKININTELQQVWAKEVIKFVSENKNKYDPRPIISSGEAAIKKAVKEKLMLLNNY